MTWRNDREKIEAYEALPDLPPRRRGRLPYAGPRGEFVEYEGPLLELGRGIPRSRSTNPILYRVQRACWHLAFGYASGFPVRAILVFTARHLWPIPDVRGIPVGEVEPADEVEVDANGHIEITVDGRVVADAVRQYERRHGA